MLPRLIRLRDAPGYLGMDIHRFNEEVRPFLVEIPIGIQGIAFDRLDLDAWVEHHKTCNGRPAVRRKIWDVNAHQASTTVTGSGTLIKRYSDAEFAKVQKQIASKKQKST